MYDIDSIKTHPIVHQVEYKDAFFQELKDQVESLVNNSLFLYVAYELKASEASKYKLDPKAEVPFLKAEAKLRGVSVEDLVALIEGKGLAFKAAVRGMELLRTEFNIRSVNETGYIERLQLRDEFISKIRKVMAPLQ